MTDQLFNVSIELTENNRQYRKGMHIQEPVYACSKELAVEKLVKLHGLNMSGVLIDAVLSLDDIDERNRTI